MSLASPARVHSQLPDKPRLKNTALNSKHLLVCASRWCSPEFIVRTSEATHQGSILQSGPRMARSLPVQIHVLPMASKSHRQVLPISCQSYPDQPHGATEHTILFCASFLWHMLSPGPGISLTSLLCQENFCSASAL